MPGDDQRSQFVAVQESLAQLEEGLTADNPSVQVRQVFAVPPKTINQQSAPVIVNQLFYQPGETLWAKSRMDVVVPTQIAIMCYDNDPAVGEQQAIALLWELMRKLIVNQTLLGVATKVQPSGVGPVGTIEYPNESGRMFQTANLTLNIVLEIPMVGGG